MGPNPAELHEMLTNGLEKARRSWRHPLRRRYIHLPARVVRIRDDAWQGVLIEERWAFTPRQARQMLAALAPVLDSYRAPLGGLLDMLNQNR